MEHDNNIFDHLKRSERPSVPDGYFDSLPAQIMAKLKADEKPALRVVYKRPVFWATLAAASVALVFILRLGQPEEKMTLADVSNQELAAYVKEHLDDFEAHDLLQSEQTASTPKQQVETEGQDKNDHKADTALTQEDILYYLNSNEVDLEEIEDIY